VAPDCVRCPDAPLRSGQRDSLLGRHRDRPHEASRLTQEIATAHPQTGPGRVQRRRGAGDTTRSAVETSPSLDRNDGLLPAHLQLRHRPGVPVGVGKPEERAAVAITGSLRGNVLMIIQRAAQRIPEIGPSTVAGLLNDLIADGASPEIADDASPEIVDEIFLPLVRPAG
jgi:hypothetical protein